MLLFYLFLLYSIILVIFAARKPKVRIMTTFALNNLWSYLQGLSLKQSDREWLASKLIEPVQPVVKHVEHDADERPVVAKRQHKIRPLSPEVELLGNLPIRDFTQEELDSDPLLAALMEDRRTKK